MALSGFYFWHFSTVGIFIAFFSLYAKHLGFSSLEISVLAALHPLSRVLWPPFWGGLADRTGRRDLVAAGASIAATASFAAYFFADRFIPLFIAQLVFTFFWSTVLPLIEATTLEQASAGRIDYGRSRMWGSIGFIIMSVSIGPVLDRLGIRFALWAILACLSLGSVATLLAPRPQGERPRRSGSLINFLRRPGVRLFFLVGFLCQLSHATMYNFLSIHLAAEGFSNEAIGFLWAFGVICEVPVIRWSSALLGRFDRMHLITFSLFVGALRWLITALTTSYPLLLLAQGMHAVTFALFHVAAVTHTFSIVPHNLRARGQTIYSALSFGAGLSVGMLLSGSFYGRVGAQACFAASALVALAAALLSLRLHSRADTPA